MAIAEIRVIVSSKKLYEALQSLEGKCLQPPVVMTAKGIKGDKKTEGPSAPGVIGELLATKKNGDVLTQLEIREYVFSKGVSKGAVYYGVQKHLADGNLKPAGKAKYRVVK